MSNKIFFLLLLTFSIIHTTSSIAEGTVRYVSKTGSSIPPYTSWATAADSIQKAINICVDGDTVIVANGVYYENLVINTQIALIGSSMDSTIIDGVGIGDHTIIFDASGSIENFNILGRGFGLSGAAIRNLQSISFIKIKNCKISETSVGIAFFNSSVSAENVLMKNLIRGFDLASANPFSYNISDCTIILMHQDSQGIRIGFASEAIAYITNNIILFTGTPHLNYGISIGAPKKIYIQNNLISGFGDNIFFDTVTDTAFIMNNTLAYQTGGGIAANIWSSGNRIFTNNTVLLKNMRGIYQVGGGFIRSDYNLFWENNVDLTGLSYGDSDRVADPMFVKDTLSNNSLDFDYHLQAYSPGIDKGNPDILDVDGSRSDIGLYGGPFGQSYTYKDLRPRAPVNFIAVIDTNEIQLQWNRNTEADTSHYNVYRDTVINFTIDSTKLVESVTNIFYTEPIPGNASKYVYKITCVDNQGNESEPSVERVINVTSINEYPVVIDDYLLYQNYPNPFNPSTTIGYKLIDGAYVKLMVYDITGALVSVLVNKEQSAGYYEVEFNTQGHSSASGGLSGISELASGIYLYRIEVIGEGRIPVYSEMKKMLMLK